MRKEERVFVAQRTTAPLACDLDPEVERDCQNLPTCFGKKFLFAPGRVMFSERDDGADLSVQFQLLDGDGNGCRNGRRGVADRIDRAWKQSKMAINKRLSCMHVFNRGQINPSEF
ncbi:hypothetical protein ACQR0Z_34445 [Bradyrhizobium sp. HKCCYLS3077]|uniref:hypothetical protein n=1 Tax=Bradyrhizobium sp. HKCCYLS3077 TaxID=3420761 RepID=UPI003EBF8928